MRLVERRAVPPFGHFNLIRFGKDGKASAERKTGRVSAAG